VTPIIYTPEALADVEEILTFLRSQDPELVEKFESDYRKALEKVREFPQAWPKVGRRVRVKIISRRFLYGIFYQYFKATVIVGAVTQLNRRSLGWRGRFRK
jgi:plasmid stabilization system protein ParE